MNLAEALSSVARSDFVNNHFVVVCHGGTCRKVSVSCAGHKLPLARETMDALKRLGLLGELERFLGKRAEASELCDAFLLEPLRSLARVKDAVLRRRMLGEWLLELRARMEFFERLREEIAKHRGLFESVPMFWLDYDVTHDRADIYGDAVFEVDLRVLDPQEPDKVRVSMRLDERSGEVKDVLVWFGSSDGRGEPLDFIFDVVRGAVEDAAARAGLGTSVNWDSRSIRIYGGIEPTAAIGIAVEALTAAATAALHSDVARQLAVAGLARETAKRERVRV